MKKKEYGLVLLLSAVTGLVGGTLSSRIFTGDPVHAQMTPPHAKVISAEAFHLVDKNGEHRASFSIGAVADQQPGIVFHDRNNTDRVKMTLMPDGTPVLSLLDHEGEARILVVGHDDKPFLDLFGKGNRAHAVLGVLADGRPDLSLYDKNGNMRTDLGLSADGNPGLVFIDHNQNTRSSFGLWPDGHPFLAIADEPGKARIVLGETKKGGTH
jgi:hypothetical protein